MNAANESSPAPSLRRLPFSVRLAPQFVNTLFAVLPEDDVSEEVQGLLFGMVETGFSVLRMFHLSSPIAGIGRQANFEELLTRSKTNPQLAGFTMLGWFSARNVGGLQPEDIDFHERNFGKPNDLALIIKVEPESELSFELYCRAADGTFSGGNRRLGTIRISNTTPLISPLEVPLEAQRAVHIPNLPIEREIEEDDSFAFLKEAFASSTRKAVERLKIAKPEEKEQTSVFNRAVDPPLLRNADVGTSVPPSTAFGTSGGAAAAPARIPEETAQPPRPAQAGDQESEEIRLDHPDIPPSAYTSKRVPATPDAVLIRSEERRADPENLSSKPNANSPQNHPLPVGESEGSASKFGVKSSRLALFSRFPTQAVRALPWKRLAAIFVLVTGATFAFIYLRSAHANGTLPQFVQAVWPTAGLDLKIASSGDRFQLSWNRNIPAVRNAREAILEIKDGPNRHEIYLGNSELGNGSVLYLPNSDDVVFRLQVHGAAGQKVTESLRVVGTARSEALQVSRPKENPDGEPEPAQGKLASNPLAVEKVKGGGARSRPSVASGPKRQRREETRPATGGRAIAKADVPKLPPASGAISAGTEGAAHASASSPAANTSSVSPPPSNDRPAAETAAASRSDAPTSSSPEKPNATETAQVSKPAEPIVPAGNKSSEDVPAKMPDPARAQPAKTDIAGAQPTAAYKPPRPLRQVLPKISTLPPGVADNVGEVKVVVRVDESGQVIDARVVEGQKRFSSMLASASLTAARQWIFEPASLRGKNIQSQHTIVFQFRH